MVFFVGSGFYLEAQSGSGAAYAGKITTGSSKPTGESRLIEDYIKRGNADYFQASKSVYALLRKVELQNLKGISIDELKMEVNRALINMKNALDVYRLLVRKAEATPYNITVLNRLQAIDYEMFRQRYQLNGNVFQEVSSLLEKGNVTDTFKFQLKSHNKIVSLLENAKASLDQNQMPPLKLFWTLNESFSTTTLVKSYVSRVFRFLELKPNQDQSLEVRYVR
jgi:hypothetical protein